MRALRRFKPYDRSTDTRMSDEDYIQAIIDSLEKCAWTANSIYKDRERPPKPWEFWKTQKSQDRTAKALHDCIRASKDTVVAALESVGGKPDRRKSFTQRM